MLLNPKEFSIEGSPEINKLNLNKGVMIGARHQRPGIDNKAGVWSKLPSLGT